MSMPQPHPRIMSRTTTSLHTLPKRLLPHHYIDLKPSHCPPLHHLTTTPSHCFPATTSHDLPACHTPTSSHTLTGILRDPRARPKRFCGSIAAGYPFSSSWIKNSRRGYLFVQRSERFTLRDQHESLEKNGYCAGKNINFGRTCND